MSKMIKRKDGSYSRRGLWDNIRANKGSGNKPTKEMLEQEAKIKAKEYRNGGPEDEETPDPPRIKGALRRLLGIKSGFDFNTSGADTGSDISDRNNKGCGPGEHCVEKFGRRAAAGTNSYQMSRGNMGGQAQGGQAPPPLEITNADDELRKYGRQDLKYKDIVQYNRKGEPYVIQGEKYPLVQRIKNLWTGTEPNDQGGVSRGARDQMQYVNPNTPTNTNMGTKEEPLGTLNWPMNYGAGTSTNTNTTGTTQIPMRPIASQEKPKFQLPNFMMNQNTDTDMHPNREDFEKSQAMNVKPKFQKAPDFKKGGFKNKVKNIKSKSSFIEESKEINFGSPSKKMKGGKKY